MFINILRILILTEGLRIFLSIKRAYKTFWVFYCIINNELRRSLIEIPNKRFHNNKKPLYLFYHGFRLWFNFSGIQIFIRILFKSFLLINKYKQFQSILIQVKSTMTSWFLVIVCWIIKNALVWLLIPRTWGNTFNFNSRQRKV